MSQVADSPASAALAHAGAPHRIERARAWMAAKGLDCLVAAGPVAVNHLLGYWRYFGGVAAAVVNADGDRRLIVAHDEGETAREHGAADSVHTYGGRGFGLVPDQTPLLAAALAALPDVADAAGIGFASDVPGLEARLRERVRAPLRSAAEELARIRLVKDADELARIRRSYELAWAAQETVRERAAPGTSEIELFTAAQASAQLAAGAPIEFLGDLLCGARSAEVCAPIRVASRTAPAQGDAIVVDLAVGCEGYWGDTAETLVVGESEEVGGAREELRAILDRCAAQLTPGRTAAEVFETMRALIEQALPGGEFPHHGGHGVGLGSYDDPHVIPDDESPLEAGMVIALEPGVYFPRRFGARVEQMYVVAPGGGRELRSLVVRRDDSRRHT
jgi:Xaa-Pro aminopeptidase